jgi:uncharacterized protein YecE (DUF72 family)
VRAVKPTSRREPPPTMATKFQAQVGCCGFVVAHDQYFRLFKVIEIQQTFYQLPRLQTAEKWRRVAPEEFEFTLKAWQLITHEPSSPTYRRLGKNIEPAAMGEYGSFRPTAAVRDAWARTAMFARALRAKFVVFQCPASFRPTKEHVANLRVFFAEIHRKGLQPVWEPRGAWPNRLVRDLCQELDLIHCVDPFHSEAQHGEIQYFRLHGLTGYQYRYTDDDLERLKVWVGKKATYVFFNNDRMKEDALRFLEMTGGGETSLDR